jgi:hypothetical protein
MSTFPNEFFTELMIILLRSFIPMTIMFSLNGFTIRKLYISSKIRSNRKGGLDAATFKKTLQFTVTVMCMNLTFFIFNLPSIVAYILKYAYKFSYDPSLLVAARIKFFWNIGLNITVLYYVLYFFITFAYNKLFRQELKSMLFSITNNKIFATDTLASSTTAKNIENNSILTFTNTKSERISKNVAKVSTICS